MPPIKNPFTPYIAQTITSESGKSPIIPEETAIPIALKIKIFLLPKLLMSVGKIIFIIIAGMIVQTERRETLFASLNI